jgi:broad specificity phosphatase PhoE
MTQSWPDTLWIVRHGESAGNVARAAAMAANAERIVLATRDVDIPLSPGGEDQATALGQWFARGEAHGQPDVLLASPYARARDTARLFRDAGGCAPDLPILLDERLREKEFGIIDGLTTSGIHALHPEQAALRAALGKFYHRPPGGESWCDVIFRLRGLLDRIALHHRGRRVMIVAHQVVVLCLRYIIEEMTEDDILAIDRAGNVANCSVTEYRHDPAADALRLVGFNATAPVDGSGIAVTTAENPTTGTRA